jgi:hypothetical protein
MLIFKSIFNRQNKFDDAVASVWFGAAVPFVMAVSATIAWAAAWLNVEFLDWIVMPIGGAIVAVVVAGGWIFPLVGMILAARGSKINKNVARAAMVLSASELIFYVVVIGSIYFNSNTFVD